MPKKIWDGENIVELLEIDADKIKFLKIRVGESYFLYLTPSVDETGDYKCTWTDESEFDAVFDGLKTRKDFKEIKSELLYNLL